MSKLGADQMVVSETHVDPAQEMVFGSTAQLLALAGRGNAAPEGWARAWLDEPVPALRGLTPRGAAASDDQMDVFRIESLLRQFEYQAGLAEAAGFAGMDVARLRTELNI
ncbi:antitoxin Xre/MbcA/ParS toxin-binding domain-containing protein [Trebonia kvetii]|uniref:antitoxin Xre/MbcA/ParS toxin-binding domain-containing protein n=1 Tax=Trebonia kvetii TaxID=2480626 RepID=UPI001651EB65|nr:antitoxin Xre/MbcA/ParS toxin-binding domain-containing protein [Trebonia kvetii]